MSTPFSHRSSLKQSNKPFKSKHASKGTLKDRAKGRTENQAQAHQRQTAARAGMRPSASTITSQSKANRRNAAKMEQRRKRAQVVEGARFFQGLNAAPKLVAIVPLCADVDATLVARSLFASVDMKWPENSFDSDLKSIPSLSTTGTTILTLDRFKQRLQLIPTRRHMLEILDALKVSDICIFVLSAKQEVDAFGETLMTAIRTQGVPSVLSAVAHLDTIPIKKQSDVRKSLTVYMEHHFPGDHKLFSVGSVGSGSNMDDDNVSASTGECLNALRYMTSIRPKSIAWRDRHAYLVADHVDFVPDAISTVDSNGSMQGNEMTENGLDVVGTMMVTGFIRGASLSANRLIHIHDYGDVQIGKIVRAAEPWSSNVSNQSKRKETTSTSAENDDMDMDDDDCFGDVTNPGHVAKVVSAKELIKRSAPGVVLQVPDPSMQESLVSENSPDPMAGEQTWPTEEELADADARVHALEQDGMMMDDDAGPFGDKKTNKKRVPKGTSSYQAAWIIDEEDENENDEFGGNQDDMDENEDDELPSFEFQDSDMKEEEENQEEEEEYEEVDLDDRDATRDDLDADEEKQQLNEYLGRRRALRDDSAFPDEVDTPQHVPARERFASYRGLKSFRTSAWDAYENLPEDYARIFRFENEKRTKKRIFDDLHEGVAAGTYVTVHLVGVSQKVAQQRLPQTALNASVNGLETSHKRMFALFSLLPHEHKMTLVNMVVQRVSGDDSTGAAAAAAQETIKSKDSVLVMNGFRRYVSQPIYSTYTRGGVNNVHKYERFLHVGRASVATMYGPVQFGPAPVMLFVASGCGDLGGSASADALLQTHAWTPGGSAVLAATGSVMDMDALRIVAKRIVLTGHPFKVHRRGAVVRFMFFNAADVAYFRPVALHTKHGRSGHIKESVGTHGYMKCEFDAGIKAHDTVCMSLYKRVYPKWRTQIYSEKEF